jgi:Helix-turn-helix domain of resolvase
MIETTPSLQQAALRARLAHETVILAQREAEKAVKLALRGKGLKPQYMARREIVILAREYLAGHPELIAEARPIIERWGREGFFGKRAASRGIKFGRKPKLTKHQREEALARKRSGETLTAIAKSYNVSHMTICRL